MPKYLIMLSLLAFLVSPAWTQDEETAGQTADTEVAEADDATLEDEIDAAAEEEETDDSDLDEQVYTDDDDDFRPSEEIPADQSIAFPTDI